MSQACIPVLFYWDDGEMDEDTWYGRDHGDDHGEAIPDMGGEIHGAGTRQRHWLWHRRYRWFDQERSTG